MPKYAAEDDHSRTVEQLLRELGFDHLRARRYGSAVIVESGPKDDAYKHFRISRASVHLWTLDMATHTGRWEHTPFRAPLNELVALVVDTFPWTLQPVH